MNKNCALRQLLDNHGCIDSEIMMSELARDFPNMLVGVKMGCSMRFIATASTVIARIEERVNQNSEDYAREIFVNCTTLDALRRARRHGLIRI